MFRMLKSRLSPTRHLCSPDRKLANEPTRRPPYIGGIAIASSARTPSGPNQGELLETRGHRLGWRDRLIAPTVRKMSPRPNPTAAAMIHKAQGGKLSIAYVPQSHWQNSHLSLEWLRSY